MPEAHLSFRCSAMADQVGIWGGCPRRLEVLASDEVDLDPDPDHLRNRRSGWYPYGLCSTAGAPRRRPGR
eukprot:CAMPEP_0181257070 /NCGR_PEP_ID=MMETSP1096-20121128/50051_1 /TAXON_ID=156174 ORGANISM="Chrysochromulina ericina, Strain CCMP281" /NCGR_SAMPLE_ID=MMETSP1096 /ASSEMBLY_ACC=CAM_ASM_000453 /LENGTH=69 /DNA_ID=CAMNT_0023355369 /DNA_START=30 /DNA_END=235 /DNA_ORIENTATION=+